MPLFQASVLKKYTNALDTATVDAAYERFTAHFHNAVIQENIRQAKEEQYQGEFLIDLFVKVLGYVKNPAPDFNLTTELKNVKDSKKADGAILTPAGSSLRLRSVAEEGAQQVIAVIELKGTAVTDLGKVETQAFGYKNNQPGCVYVITSNFEKLRFYIDNAVDFEEFNLFQLTRERFEVLWLCLSAEKLLRGLPKQIKDESLNREEVVTKTLYKDYALFRNEVFNNIVSNNPQHDKLTLFKETQKLLDRFLFIFFAEDRLLLPPNSILSIVQQWKDLKDKYDAYTPLYERFKKYFGYLNTGYKGKNHDIFAYNGGLFKPDPILDDLTIDDELLEKHTMKLSNYDFVSEVSVNILGHIFEHSLNDIEEIQAEIEGQPVDKTAGKRKKDGVFYTPKYITKYIVDNTVGKLCEEQKTALGIDEAEYDKGRKNRPVKVVKALAQKLDDYRAWLLQLTICDPACGSGAFLNQALEFLIAEHAYVDELRAKLFGDALLLSDVENSILENNLYGVDINQESVEIAKLSLWLRTAQKGRKLTSLNNNIKCGNSLIDDPAVAGDKAFDWEKEFPQVFAKGGFDVVIGNPPYVRQELVKEFSNALQKYEVFSGKSDLYTYFYEKGSKILKDKGFLSFISSGKFFEASYGENLIKYLISNFKFMEIVNFDDLEVFEGISAYPLIFTAQKLKEIENYNFNYAFVPNLNFTTLNEIVTNLPFELININDFTQNDYKFFSTETASIFKKINTNSIYLKDINCLPLVGVKTGFNDGFTIIDEKDNYLKPYIFGKNLKKYLPPTSETCIVFPYERYNNEYKLVDEFELGKHRDFLLNNRLKLESRAIIKDGLKNNTKSWYEYQQINKKLDFDSEYIVYPNVSLGTNFTLSKGNVIDMTGFIIPSNDKFLLAILNSKICEFVMRRTAITRRGGYQEYKVQYLEKVPLKNISEEEKTPYSKRVDSLLNLNIEINNVINNLIKLLQSKFPIEKLSKNLQSWHTLDFKGFLKELKKAKVSLTLPEEAEWMAYFNGEKEKAQALQNDIDRLDKEIDQMVYGLYGLTEEEVAIVENS